MYLIYGLQVREKIEYVGYCLARRFDARMSEHRYYNTVETSDFMPVILFENIPSLPEAGEMEKVYIDVHSTFDNGYNKTRGGGRNTEVSDKSKKKMAASQQKRVEDGTHHLLGGAIHRQRVEDGTHPFLGGEIQRETCQRRVEDGTHPWLGPEQNQRRVEDGTHNWLDSEAARDRANKRLADGTHHFLKGQKSRSIRGNLAKAKYKVVYQYAVMIPKTYWESLNNIYRTRQLKREGFFDKDIADTSQAEQGELF